MVIGINEAVRNLGIFFLSIFGIFKQLAIFGMS
jgi:hypothetical protein